VNYYLKKSTLSSPEILDGRIYDQVWQEEIDTKRQLHIGRSLIKFHNPKTQVKLEVDYLDRFQLVGVMDALDLIQEGEDGDKILYEFKTGTTSSLEYADGHQIKMYFFIAGLKGIPIKTSRVIRYNQYKDEADITIFHNTETQRLDAENYIQTLGSEIYFEFEKQGII